MDSLDDIWDAPVAPKSPSRAREPLFIEGHSDDENDQMPDAPPRRPADPADVDSLFSGVADLPDEDGNDSRSSGTPYQVGSSSPAHHLNGDGEGGGGENKDAKKPKKKAMRLDEGRLVGDSGFPQLIQDTKNVKIKGKGHEASDLNRLLQVYQFWTHRLYPKTPFKDTVDRVEKLCHSKRMHNMLGVWRDEAHGIVNGKKPGEDEDEDQDGGGTNLTVDPSSLPGPDSDQADYASSSSHAATRPPSSAEGDGDADDFDFDADAMDASARINARQTDSDTDYASRDEVDAALSDAPRPMTDDDEASWQEVHGAGPAKPASHTPMRGNEEDDEDLWALIEGSTLTVPKPTASLVRAVPRDPLSDEEEGWNMMDDLDDSSAKAPVPPPRVISSVEEDYEDMYMDGS